MEADNFFLPTGYVANHIPVTRDDVSDGGYWRTRVAAAASYQFPVYQLALRLALQRNAHSIIDIGCGLGQKLRYIHDRAPDIMIVGLDQPSAIRYCTQEYDFGTWHAVDLDAANDDAPSVEGDVVICADVIEHVRNPDLLLDRVRRHCASGGVIILSTPARERLRGGDCLCSPNPQHVREWSSAELRRYVEDRGLRVLLQRLALPVRVGFNRAFVDELWSSVRARRTTRYSQICVLST
jgi:SAM-dependent methyltransferase